MNSRSAWSSFEAIALPDVGAALEEEEARHVGVTLFVSMAVSNKAEKKFRPGTSALLMLPPKSQRRKR